MSAKNLPADPKRTFYSVKSFKIKEHKQTILVVDDLPANLRLLSQILTQAGYRVRVATDGEQALLSIFANPPDLILLDVMMSGLDGYDVCVQLKANVKTRNIPVIFISAREDADAKLKAFDVGGVDYVPKPFHPKEVLARVRVHIALQELQRNLRQQVIKHEKLIVDLDAANAQLQKEIAERERFEQALLESKEHFRTVVDFTYNWEYWLGPDGCFMYISPSCHRITGYRAEEFQKNPRLMVEIVHADDRDDWLRHLNTILGSHDVFSLRFRTLTREGEERWIGHTCQPVFNSEGKFLGRRASNRDITDQIIAEKQLWRYASDLQAQNEELDAFAHTVAHDLKNPLAGLIGFSYLLEAHIHTLSQSQIVEMAQTVGQNARKMSNIVDELLLLSSVRKLDDVDIQPVDMADIVPEALKRLRDMIEDHHAELDVPQTWPVVLGYAPWLEEVWANYISNAIKYGGQQDQEIPPKIELGFDVPDDDGASSTAPSQIRFWVRDNGAGLSPEQKAQLFTQFTRLHQSQVEGHGLGLSIVQRIMDKLQGQVGVDSEPNQGSTFWFTLPTVLP